MAGARKCPSCGRWLRAGKTFCDDACAKVGCPHRLQVWTWIGDKLRPWTQVYLPRIMPCEVNHRTRGAIAHHHREAGAWT